MAGMSGGQVQPAQQMNPEMQAGFDMGGNMVGAAAGGMQQQTFARQQQQQQQQQLIGECNLGLN